MLKREDQRPVPEKLRFELTRGSQFSAIFDNFRRKNWRFFSKTNVMIIFLNNLALLRVKNANFSQLFSAKIF
jgi:Fe-S cluster biosynthesis and repair protein YggX